jgi:hypothetical protein
MVDDFDGYVVVAAAIAVVVDCGSYTLHSNSLCLFRVTHLKMFMTVLIFEKNNYYF